jgi:tryptophanyl-tRNA synthetase
MGPGARIMSLRDGTQKMSKSDPSDFSRINLLDDEAAIANKIKKAKTDPEPLTGDLSALAKRPEADNLLSIYAALAGREKKSVAAEFDGRQFSEFKQRLADLAVAELFPIRERIARLMGDPAELDRILHGGAERAAARAAPILAEVKRVVGFLG